MCHTTRDYTDHRLLWHLWLFCSFRMIFWFLSYESNTVQLFNLFLCTSAFKIKMTGNPNHCMITSKNHTFGSKLHFHHLWNAFRQNPRDAGFQDVAWHSGGLAFLFCCGYSGGHYLCLWKRWCSTWTGWTTRDCTRCFENLKDIKTRRVDTYHIYENRDWT